MINPNLLISIRYDEVKKMEEMANLLYGELTEDDLREKIVEMRRIIILFNTFGVCYNIEKIKIVVNIFKEHSNHVKKIVNIYRDGKLEYIRPPSINQLDFLAIVLTGLTEDYFEKAKKGVGKRDSKIIFGDNIYGYDADYLREYYSL